LGPRGKKTAPPPPPLKKGIQLATGSYINEFIYAVVQAPLSAAVQSTAGVVIMAVVCQLFWFLGIHGGLVVEPIRSPISAAGLAENIAAVQAGLTPAYPLTRGFWTVFVVVGGAGLTLSLIFAILMFSKREDHRAIAKLSLLPGICGIGEPMVFGLPLVLNPVFAIPFILNSGIAAAIGLFAIKIGLLLWHRPRENSAEIPFRSPLLTALSVLLFPPCGWTSLLSQPCGHRLLPPLQRRHCSVCRNGFQGAAALHFLDTNLPERRRPTAQRGRPCILR